MEIDTRGITQRSVIPIGTTTLLNRNGYSIPVPATLAAIPGSGGTLLVEYQLAADGAWTAWPAGAAATKTVYVLTGPVYALRFTAAVADGVVEMAQ